MTNAWKRSGHKEVCALDGKALNGELQDSEGLLGGTPAQSVSLANVKLVRRSMLKSLWLFCICSFDLFF